MKFNISRTKVILFTTRKTNMIYFEYKLCDSRIISIDTVTDLRVFLDSKLYFH
jgi:hypothetical protein